MKKTTIMVVDDSQADRVKLETLLSEAGYKVLTCSSGHEALEVANEKSPDLIFLDIVMEGMDGFQTCRRLKETNDTKDIPVVMVSSKNQKVDKRWASKQGAAAYVSKPYTPDDIQDQIKELQVA